MGNLTIGEYIKRERNDNKISIAQLSESSGVSSPYISQIESNTRNPSTKVLKQLYEGFSKLGINVPYSYLLLKAGFTELGKKVELEEQVVTLPIILDDSLKVEKSDQSNRISNQKQLDLTKQHLKNIRNKINNIQSTTGFVPMINLNINLDDQDEEQFNLEYHLDELLKFKNEQLYFKNVHLSRSEVNLIKGFIELLIENRKE